MLVAEINLINKENLKLKSILKLMNSKYNDLQMHIRSLYHKLVALIETSYIILFWETDLTFG